MTFKTSASSFRLGISVFWNSPTSPKLFEIKFRISVFFNAYLRGFLKWFRIKLVKWVIFFESKSIKLLLITMRKLYSELQKIRYKRRGFKYAFWNKIYYDKVSFKVKKLMNFQSKIFYKLRVRLGSGRFWHKVFRSIFFMLGKRYVIHKLKKFRITNNFEELSGSRDFDRVLKRPYVLKAQKRADIIKMQYFYLLNFRKQILFLQLSRYFLNKKQWKFSKQLYIHFLIINKYLKKNLSFKNNKPIRKVYSRFENLSNAYLNPYFMAIVPNTAVRFNFFSRILGADLGWDVVGEINNEKVQNYKRANVPFFNFFIKGVLSPNSFKKFFRKRMIGVYKKPWTARNMSSNVGIKKNKYFGKTKKENELKEISDRAWLMNYIIKQLIFQKSMSSGLMNVRNFFFNRSFKFRNFGLIRKSIISRKVARFNMRRKKLTKKIFQKKKSDLLYRFFYRISSIDKFLLKKFQLKFIKKRKKFLALIRRLNSNTRLINQYFYNTSADNFNTKYGHFIRVVRSQVNEIRLSFLNKYYLNNNFLFKKKLKYLFLKKVFLITHLIRVFNSRILNKKKIVQKFKNYKKFSKVKVFKWDKQKSKIRGRRNSCSARTFEFLNILLEVLSFKILKLKFKIISRLKIFIFTLKTVLMYTTYKYFRQNFKIWNPMFKFSVNNLLAKKKKIKILKKINIFSRLAELKKRYVFSHWAHFNFYWYIFYVIAIKKVFKNMRMKFLREYANESFFIKNKKKLFFRRKIICRLFSYINFFIRTKKFRFKNFFHHFVRFSAALYYRKQFLVKTLDKKKWKIFFNKYRNKKTTLNLVKLCKFFSKEFSNYKFLITVFKHRDLFKIHRLGFLNISEYRPLSEVMRYRKIEHRLKKSLKLNLFKNLSIRYKSSNSKNKNEDNTRGIIGGYIQKVFRYYEIIRFYIYLLTLLNYFLFFKKIINYRIKKILKFIYKKNFSKKDVIKILKKNTSHSKVFRWILVFKFLFSKCCKVDFNDVKLVIKSLSNIQIFFKIFFRFNYLLWTFVKSWKAIRLRALLLFTRKLKINNFFNINKKFVQGFFISKPKKHFLKKRLKNKLKVVLRRKHTYLFRMKEKIKRHRAFYSKKKRFNRRLSLKGSNFMLLFLNDKFPTKLSTQMRARLKRKWNSLRFKFMFFSSKFWSRKQGKTHGFKRDINIRFRFKSKRFLSLNQAFFKNYFNSWFKSYLFKSVSKSFCYFYLPQKGTNRYYNISYLKKMKKKYFNINKWFYKNYSTKFWISQTGLFSTLARHSRITALKYRLIRRTIKDSFKFNVGFSSINMLMSLFITKKEKNKFNNWKIVKQIFLSRLRWSRNRPKIFRFEFIKDGMRWQDASCELPLRSHIAVRRQILVKTWVKNRRNPKKGWYKTIPKFVTSRRLKRKIGWYIYKSLFKRSVSMHSGVSAKFFNRYSKKRLANFSVKSSLITFQNLLHKFLANFVIFQKVFQKKFNYSLKKVTYKKIFKIKKTKFLYISKFIIFKIFLKIIKHKFQLFLSAKYNFILETLNKRILNLKVGVNKFFKNWFFILKEINKKKINNKMVFLLFIIFLNKNKFYFKNENQESNIMSFDTRQKTRVDEVLLGKFFKNLIKYSDFFFNELKPAMFNSLKHLVAILNLFGIIAKSIKNFKKISFIKFFLVKLQLFKKYKIFLKLNLNLKLSSKKWIFNSLVPGNVYCIVLAFYNFFHNIKIIVYKKASFYHFKLSGFSFSNWLRLKKFNFWIEYEIEKLIKCNIKVFVADAVKTVVLAYRKRSKKFYKLVRLITTHRRMGGWREQTIYIDILWTVLVAIKYYSSSFVVNMIAEQIIKRKKHWTFIKRLRGCFVDVLPATRLIKSPFVVHSIRVCINGKINGKNRSINYLFAKYLKKTQKSKINQLFLKVDYAVAQAKSMYGSFGIRIYIVRL